MNSNNDIILIICPFCGDKFNKDSGFRRHLDYSLNCKTHSGKRLQQTNEATSQKLVRKQSNEDRHTNESRFNHDDNLGNMEYFPLWETGKIDHHLQPFQEPSGNNSDLYIIDHEINSTIQNMDLCNPNSLEENDLPDMVDFINTLKEEENSNFLILNRNNTATTRSIKKTKYDSQHKYYHTSLFEDSSDGMLTSLEIFSLELFMLLLKGDAPNYFYDSIMALIQKYIVNQIKHISTTFSSRSNVVKHFSSKYNMHHLRPRIEYFSFKMKNFPIITFDCEQMIMSLLQDKKRLFNDDSLIFPTMDGTPFGELNTEPSNLEDINTAKAFIDGHMRVTKDTSKDLPIGVIFYLDKITLDKHGHISMEPLQFTLSIFCRHARNTPYAWRTCGFIPNIGLHSKAESKHLFKAEEKAHLTHLILQKILTDYKKLEETDIQNYQFFFKGNQYIANLKFFVLVVLGDTEAHDKLCAHYNCRMLSVKCICRHCPIPSDLLDDPFSNYPLTLQSDIDKLVEDGDISSLKNLSQYNFQSVWKSLGITFGGNDRGIHGVTPSEPLHMIDLGILKYLVVVFFASIGSQDSKLHSLVDTWAKRVGKHLQHQSDRNLPRTYFPNGISGGTKLNGHEYVGVVLVLAILLRMDGPRKTILKYQDSMSGKKLDQWANLFELCVCWRKWLQKESIPKEEAVRSKKAHMKLVEIIIKYAERQEGNEWKIIKLHMILHIHTNLIDFAVPLNIDTSVPESNHKYNVKKPASHTQKRASVLEIQAATRYYENLVMEFSSLIVSSRTSTVLPKIKQSKAPNNTTSYNKMRGSKFEIIYNKKGPLNEFEVKLVWKTESMKFSYHSRYINWLGKHLFPIFEASITKVEGCTKYHRQGLIF